MNQNEMSVETDVSRRQRFHKLLKRRSSKVFRDNCFRFFDYLYTMAPDHEKIIEVMRIIHQIQFLLICLCPLSKNLWPKDSHLGKIINILSIITNLCTNFASDVAYISITIIVYILFVLFFGVMLWSLRVFQKYTKISTLTINLISIVLNALLPYFIIFLGYDVGKSFYSLLEKNESFPLHVFLVVFGLLLSALLFALQVIFVTPSLTFRPQNVHILDSVSMSIYLGSIYVIAFLSALAGGLNNFIPLFISIVPLSFLHYLVFLRPDSWVSSDFSGKIMALLECSSLALLVECFFLVFGIRMNEILLLIVLALYIGLRYAAKMHSKHQQNQFIALCDKLQEEPELLDQFTFNQIIFLLRIGFECGHKFCHTWEAFNLVEQKFPKNRRILFLLIRYTAIYPDESAMFKHASILVREAKKHNLELKFLRFQINSLHQQRERGLSKSLKKTLNHILDKTEKCRSQMRFIWESVIRGNIADLENLSVQLKKNEEDILREYNQLCLVYPNNPYVASAFAAYLGDMLCKDKEASEFVAIYRLLRNGARTRIEQTYYFAMQQFKFLPNEQKHAAMNDTKASIPRIDSQSFTSMTSVAANVGGFGDTNDPTEDKSQQRYIEAMIDNVHLPSMRYGPILIFISISLLFPLITLPFYLYVNDNMNVNFQSIQLFKVLRHEQLLLSHMVLAFLHYSLSTNHLATDLSSILNLQNMTSLQYLLSITQCAEDYLNDINTLFPDMFKTGYFENSLLFLFTESLTYPKVFPNNSLAPFISTYQYYLTKFGEATARAAALRSTSLISSRDLWTSVYSFSSFVKQSDNFSSIQIEDIRGMLIGNLFEISKIVLTSGFIVLIIFLGVTIFVFFKMHKEKGALFRSFKSLPKSTISTIVSKLNAQSGKYNEAENNMHKALTSQEEHALRFMTMMQNQHFVNYSYLPIFIILLIFTISAILIMYFLVYSQNHLSINLPKMITMINAATDLHITAGLVILNEIRIVMQNVTSEELSGLESRDELIAQTIDLVNSIGSKLHHYRFGSLQANSTGLSGIGNQMFEEFTKSPEISLNLPNDESDILYMLSLENSFIFIQSLLYDLLIELLTSVDATDLDDSTLSLSLLWYFNISYPDLVLQTYTISINQAMEFQSNVKVTYIIAPIVIFDVVIFICGILLIPRFIRSGEVAQWAMRLMLFCQPNIVLQSRPIIKILSNDFTTDENDENDEKSSFFESIVANLSDPVIFLDNEFIIRSSNTAFNKLFGGDKIGTSLLNLFHYTPTNSLPESTENSINSTYNINNSDDANNYHFYMENYQCKSKSLIAFEATLKNILAARVAPVYNGDVYVSIKGEERLLHLDLFAVNSEGEIQKKTLPPDFISTFALEIKNISNLVEFQARLEEEKFKIHKIYDQVLPKAIVERVMMDINNNKTEKDICYDIQSASIIFIDIVEFSKWSTSVEPAAVMATINSINEEFDRIMNKYPTLTKIKSLGDNYLAAGGIFEEVNQPQVHARQILCFGLDCISALDIYNAQQNMSLKIRVGANTGGPVVAGLLNLTKPSFEVLGDSINLASELERTSLPMNVHIPRHVYELILSNEFLIKDGEELIFREKVYQTYLITGYDKSIY